MRLQSTVRCKRRGPAAPDGALMALGQVELSAVPFERRQGSPRQAVGSAS
jgi:hypothetical protein